MDFGVSPKFSNIPKWFPWFVSTPPFWGARSPTLLLQRIQFGNHNSCLNWVSPNLWREPIKNNFPVPVTGNQHVHPSTAPWVVVFWSSQQARYCSFHIPSRGLQSLESAEDVGGLDMMWSCVYNISMHIINIYVYIYICNMHIQYICIYIYIIYISDSIYNNPGYDTVPLQSFRSFKKSFKQSGFSSSPGWGWEHAITIFKEQTWQKTSPPWNEQRVYPWKMGWLENDPGARLAYFQG